MGIKAKSSAWNAVSNARLRGDIERLPCEECGKEESYAHHDDYLAPLSVRWLCRSHHRLWHNENGPGRNANVIVGDRRKSSSLPLSPLGRWMESAGVSAATVAKVFGVSGVTAHHWTHGGRRPGEKFREAIERWTDGAVAADAWQTKSERDEQERLDAVAPHTGTEG